MLCDAGVVTFAIFPDADKILEARRTAVKYRTVEHVAIMKQYNCLTNNFPLLRCAALPESLWNMLERVNDKVRNQWIYEDPSVKAALKKGKKGGGQMSLQDALAKIDFSKFENPISNTFLKAIVTGVDEILLEECLTKMLSTNLAPAQAIAWLSTTKDILTLRTCIAKHFNAVDNTIDCLRGLLGPHFNEEWLLVFAKKKPKFLERFIAEETKRIKAEQKKGLHGKRKRANKQEKAPAGDDEEVADEQQDLTKLDKDFWESLYLRLDHDIRLQLSQWFSRQQAARAKRSAATSSFLASPSKDERTEFEDSSGEALFDYQFSPHVAGVENDGYDFATTAVISIYGPKADLTTPVTESPLSLTLFNILNEITSQQWFEHVKHAMKFNTSQRKLKLLFRYANLNAPWGWGLAPWDKERWTPIQYARCLRQVVGKQNFSIVLYIFFVFFFV